jgi:hypothetical protein
MDYILNESDDIISKELILNNDTYIKNTKYFNLNSNSHIIINDDNDIDFTKINKNKCPHAWFGYNMSIGNYQLEFDIMTDKKIDKGTDIGVKIHNPIRMYNDFLDDVVPNTWKSIEINVEIANSHDLLIFIFDGFNDELNVKFKNIKLNKNKIIMGFFGFVRNFPPNYNIPLSNKKIYIHVPSLRYEDKKNIITSNELCSVYGNDIKCNIYEYDKDVYIKKSSSLNVPKFNQFYQQSYRIFSFFNNLKCSIKMIHDDNYIDSNSIIILCRSDIGISDINYTKMQDLLFRLNYDIIVHNRSGKYGYDDKYFIFKQSSIDVFYNLYDDYETYLKMYYNGNVDNIETTRPEDIFKHHFNKYNKKVAIEPIIQHIFGHVCNVYCGHNGNNTKT